MARKPDSNNIRKLKGDPNKDRYLPEINIDLLNDIPEPPEFLCARGIKIFNEVAGYLITHKIITNLDVLHLAHSVDQHIQIIKMRESGMPVPSSMYTTWKSFTSDLFMNPMARQKFMGGGDTKKGNKYDKPRPKK
jgi:phage terminase small subunit